MKYENLLKKYDVTKEELDEAVDQICKAGISNCVNSYAMIAIVDLMTSGDIKYNEN